MAIIKGCPNDFYLNQSESGLQVNNNTQIEFNKELKTTDYFDYIYSYPPKIKIKWDKLDDLKNDFFVASPYSRKHKLYTDDFIDDWTFSKVSEKSIFSSYPKSKYFDGFLDKLHSSNFFLKKTKKIQCALSNVPVFVILNGNSEIVLSKPSNVLGSKTPTTYLNEKLYDYCGDFDPIVEKKSELGLFFVNYLDAEKYLKEVARNDFEGTNTVSLSIHCISLDSAYRITREYHPGIDFRFVPDFTEVKELLVNKIGISDTIVADRQQQMRLRYRNTNVFPYLNKLGGYLSPHFSLLQRNEYFKGVPIYIVQLNDKPRNFLFEQYFNIIGRFDVIYARCLQSLNYVAGFGHNWVIEGSIEDLSDKFDNYIFFEKDQAQKFSKKHGRKVVRYKGGRLLTTEYIVRKPKIFIYNLEDFLENWEDSIHGKLTNNKNIAGKIFESENNYFIAPITSSNKLNSFSKNDRSSTFKNVAQSANIKFRVLKHTLGVFFRL